MRNKITNEQLLDCLTQGQELITAHGMNDLRSTLKNRGYGSQITPLDIEDVMKIAENLVEKNQAFWKHSIWKHSNWLQITPTGMVAAGCLDEVIEFSTQHIDELESNNYFGSEDDQQVIRNSWTAELSKLGFNVGQTYWQHEFDVACNVALTLAINK
jgi:hypothetical protein